jgi:hypothetical protein
MGIVRVPVLFRAGGECYERYGVMCHRTTSIAHGGEELQETFTRADAATCATYVDRDGYVRRALADVPRVSWYDGDGDGTREAHLLLESSRINSILRSEELSNASWTKSGATVGADAGTAPDGATTADRLIEGAGGTTHYAEQSASVSPASPYYNSITIYLKAGTRTWAAVEVYNTAVTGDTGVRQFVNLSTGALGSVEAAGTQATVIVSRVEAATDGWYRLFLTVDMPVASTSVRLRVYTATGDGTESYSGDGASYVSVWGAQVELNMVFPSSYIQTVGTIITRAADRLEFPFYAHPQAMTVYAHFIERAQPNWVIVGGFSPRIMHIGKSDDTGARLLLYKPNGTASYRILHINGSTQVSRDHTPSGPHGQRFEWRGILNSDGSVQIGVSKNGAAESLGTASAANTLAAAWSTPTLVSLGCIGANGQGDILLRSLIIAAGVQTLATMQGL